MFEAMNRDALNQLKPVVDRVFEFKDVQAAFKHMESGRISAKVCIRI